MPLTNQQAQLISGLGEKMQQFMQAESDLREINRIVNNRDYAGAGLTDQDLIDGGFEFTLADIARTLTLITSVQTLLNGVVAGGQTGYDIADTVRLYRY